MALILDMKFEFLEVLIANLFILIDLLTVLAVDGVKTLLLTVNSITVKLYNWTYEEAAYLEYLIDNLKYRLKPRFFRSRILCLEVFHYVFIRSLWGLEATLDLIQAIWESLED